MPTQVQLRDEGERIRKSLTDVLADDTLSATEKAEKVKGIEAEFQAFNTQIETMKIADGIRKGLPEAGDEVIRKDAQDFGAGDSPE